MAKDVKFNIKLNVDGKDIVVKASTNVKQLADNLGLVHDNVTAADKAFMKWTQSVMAISSMTSSIQQISGVLNTLTEDSRAFGAAMKAANTMAGKDAEGFGQLKDQVAELSKTIPLARDELAKGLYQVISNGAPEDNWISYLQTSSKAAVGGIANLEEVVKVTSTVIKNYGLEWSAAGDIQDKIQLTAKNGVTSFEQLAAALPSVTGQAAQLGVSFTEMLAVMSTLTGVTGNTSEVATQLASVLTALTKESSKSQKMAEEMGISFNAASIRAAGGFRNFLQELDKTVTAYSEKTGQLKESIYSKLFGRAEALRLVNGLTGEMASKFDENIQALDNSAGTIDKAFGQMASTGSATTQMLKNQFGAIQDVVSSVVGAIQPYLNFTAQLGMTTLSVMSLTKAFNGLTKASVFAKVSAYAQAAASKVAALAQNLWSKQLYYGRQANIAWAFSAKLATVQAIAMRTAILGLMAVTGVGIAIAAVAGIISLFADNTDDAAESINNAAGSMNAVRESASRAQQTFDDTMSDTYSRLMTRYRELQSAWKTLSSQHSKIQWIKDNSQAFEDLGIKISSVADAEQAFSKNTDAVVQAFTERAKAAARLAQLTEEYRMQMQLTDKITRADAAANSRHKVKAGDRYTVAETKSWDVQPGDVQRVSPAMGGGWAFTEQGAARYNSMRWVANTSADRANRQALKDSQERAKKLESEIAGDVDIGKPYSFTSPTSVASTGSSSAGSNADMLIKDAKSYADLTHNISIYKKQLDAADPSNTQLTESLRRQIATTEQAAQAVKDLQNGWDLERPDTLEEIDEAISRQQTLRKKASADNLQRIDSEIARLAELKRQIENSAAVNTSSEQIKTYEQLENAISSCNEEMKTASADERTQIQLRINNLERLRKKWDDTLSELSRPGSLETLNTIDELDEAIGFYSSLQKKQSASEIADTQRLIAQLERKREALLRPADLVSIQDEIDEINALDGRDLKVRIKDMGFDVISDKIHALQKMLDDVSNPPTDGQRRWIEDMIGTYESWRRESVSTFDALKGGWDGIKGIGNSIQTVTDALEGNGDAWQKVTATVDAFISFYESINAIVGIINMLTAASLGHAAAKTAEAASETAEAEAESTGAVVSEGAAAAQIPVIAANKLATASYVELAAAEYMAAHAYIPFAGFGIASGFAASAATLVQSIGLMPFADGGVVSGPTMALIGEYAGANNNPEIVAPLDRLRDLIEPQDSAGGKVEFEIKGRKLVGILEKEYSRRQRS